MDLPCHPMTVFIIRQLQGHVHSEEENKYRKLYNS